MNQFPHLQRADASIDSPKKFGVLLREERKRAKRSVKEVAQVLKCTVGHVGQAEVGWVRPFSAEQIETLATLFNCSPAPLLEAARRQRADVIRVIVVCKDPRIESIATALSRNSERLSGEDADRILAILQGAR